MSMKKRLCPGHDSFREVFNSYDLVVMQIFLKFVQMYFGILNFGNLNFGNLT